MRATCAALALACLLFAGCDSERRAISRDDLPDVPIEPTVTVDLDDDGFSVDELEITTADLVEFRIDGDENHGVRTDDYAIDTGPLFPGESTEIIFDRAGSYTVVDTADEDAVLEVVVSETVSP